MFGVLFTPRLSIIHTNADANNTVRTNVTRSNIQDTYLMVDDQETVRLGVESQTESSNINFKTLNKVNVRALVVFISIKF